MANKLQKLTTNDKNKVLSGTSYVLPNNPSDKGWSADQIRQKGYQGIEELFNLIQQAISDINDDLNDRALSTTLTNQVTNLNNLISELNSSLSNEVVNRSNADTTIQASITSINTSIQQLNTRIDNISISSDYAKKSDVATAKSQANAYTDTKIANVMEVANGKTKTYVLSYNDTMPDDETLTYNPIHYYYEDGTRITSQAQLLEKLGSGFELTDFVNSKFNSTNDSIGLYDVAGGFILCKGENKYIFKKLFLSGTSYINIGDVFLITQTNVPDRWYGGNGSAYKMETAKVDLTNYVDKTSAETISGVKTFANGLKVGTKATFTQDDQYNIKLLGGNFVSNSHYPNDNESNLGKDTKKWKNLYLSGKIKDGTYDYSLIKEINTQYIRPYDLDVGIYIWKAYKNESGVLQERFIYYDGATNTTNKRGVGAHQDCIIRVYENESNGTKGWNCPYNPNVEIWGYTTSTRGHYFYRYLGSPIRIINGSDYLGASTSIYAPTTSGSSKQVVMSAGNNTPTFAYNNVAFNDYALNFSGSSITLDLNDCGEIGADGMGADNDDTIQIMPTNDSLDDWIENGVSFTYSNGVITFTSESNCSVKCNILFIRTKVGTIL